MIQLPGDTLLRTLSVYSTKKRSSVSQQLSPKCRFMLRKCSWGGKDQVCDDIFLLRKTQDGYCCTFNYARRNDGFGRCCSLINGVDYSYNPCVILWIFIVTILSHKQRAIRRLHVSAHRTLDEYRIRVRSFRPIESTVGRFLLQNSPD